jgi:hypothetical protein
MDSHPATAAELWHLILSTIKSEQEHLLARESLIYALAPRAIYALHPDQFTSVATIYGMKLDLFKRLQHNQAIEYLYSEEALTQKGDT